MDPWAHWVSLHLGAQSSRRPGPTLSVVSVLFCPALTVLPDGLQLIRAKALNSFSIDSTFLSNLLHIWEVKCVGAQCVESKKYNVSQ